MTEMDVTQFSEDFTNNGDSFFSAFVLLFKFLKFNIYSLKTLNSNR